MVLPSAQMPIPSIPQSVVSSPSQVPLAIDLSTVLDQLQSLSEAIASLKAQEGSAVSTPGCKSSHLVPYDSSHSPPVLASTMSRDEVMSLPYWDGSSPQNCIGQLKSFTTSWAVMNFATTNISCKSATTANG
jgi:hypothetical protein